MEVLYVVVFEVMHRHSAESWVVWKDESLSELCLSASKLRPVAIILFQLF